MQFKKCTQKSTISDIEKVKVLGFITANICRMARLGFGRMRTGVIFGCHQILPSNGQILTRVGFEPELGFIDSG